MGAFARHKRQLHHVGEQAVTPLDVLTYLKGKRLAVIASLGEGGHPQAALVGYGISDSFEIVFDTLGTTRKAANLRAHAGCAVVVGDEEEITVQIEGVADELQGDELSRLKGVYFAAYPDGPERQNWKDITYFRVRPTWLRLSDYRPGGLGIQEWTIEKLLSR